MISAKPGVLDGTQFEGLTPEELTKALAWMAIPDCAVITKIVEEPGQRVGVRWELPEGEQSSQGNVN